METPVCSPGKRVDQYEWDTVRDHWSNVLVRTSFGKCKIYGVRTDSSDLS